MISKKEGLLKGYQCQEIWSVDGEHQFRPGIGTRSVEVQGLVAGLVTQCDSLKWPSSTTHPFKNPGLLN